MEYPKVRHPYFRQRSPTNLEGQSLRTDQSQGNDTDVNNIVARFARTGEIPPGKPGQYADVTGLQGDLTEMIERGKEAEKELHLHKHQKQTALVLQRQKDAEELRLLREKNVQTDAPNPADNPNSPSSTTEP